MNKSKKYTFASPQNNMFLIVTGKIIKKNKKIVLYKSKVSNIKNIEREKNVNIFKKFISVL